MNRLSLRNKRLTFETSGKLLSHFRGIYGIYLKLVQESPKVSTCNRLDFGNTRVLIAYAQKPPRTLVFCRIWDAMDSCLLICKLGSLVWSKWGQKQCPGRFLGIIGPYPGVSKSNQLYDDVFRFFFIKLGYIL